MHLFWLEIREQALRANVALFRHLAPDSRFMAVVKSNAYGHGLELCVRALAGHVDWFGVNSVPEAIRVCTIDADTPILVMGGNGYEGSALREMSLEQRAQISMVLSSADALRDHLSQNPDVAFHIKVDTGLSRLGAGAEEFTRMLAVVRAAPEPPLWRGFMTHFANVEDVTDQDYARRQLEEFTRMRELAASEFRQFRPILHSAASAPAMVLPESRMDLIRVGISLYGLWPSRETRLSLLSQLGQVPDLQPAMAFKARIVHVKHVRAGMDVGYGCTYRLRTDSTLAIIPVGYYEGYDRHLSNRAHVLIRGRRAPVLGRVSMNMIIVDVSHIPDVQPGEVATLIGRDGDECVSVDDLAGLTGTINYEVCTRFIADVPRIAV